MKILLLLVFFTFDAIASGIPATNVKGGIPNLIKTVVDVIVLDETASNEYLDNDKAGSPDGTGFIIDENGYVVTNCHVVGSQDKIKIVLHDGSEYIAKVIGKDSRFDIALLKINADVKLPFVQFADSDKSEVGDPVVAIGNPFGFGKTVTSGIVSYKGRNLSNQIAELGTCGDLVRYLQTDAAINCGNSGGPLFSYDGEVIGMITVFLSDDMRNTGINFAIPSNTLKKVIKELRDHGKLQHSWLGISVSPITRRVAYALGLGKQHGCVVTKVEKNSPAADIGVQMGDILILLDNETISENTNLECMLNNLPVGKTIPIQIVRNRVEMKFSIKVGSKNDDDFPSDTDIEREEIPYEKIEEIGIGVTELTSDLRKSFDIQNNINGVMISCTEDLQSNDIAVGDVILMVNQTNISTVEDLKAELNKLSKNAEIKKNKEIALYIFASQSRKSNYVAVGFNSVEKTNSASNRVGKKLVAKRPFAQTKKSNVVTDSWKNFRNNLKTKWSLF